MDDLERAEMAYNAYGKASEFRTPNGDPMPRWEVLTDAYRQAWVEVVRAVQTATALPEYVPVTDDILPFATP